MLFLPFKGALRRSVGMQIYYFFLDKQIVRYKIDDTRRSARESCIWFCVCQWVFNLFLSLTNIMHNIRLLSCVYAGAWAWAHVRMCTHYVSVCVWVCVYVRGKVRHLMSLKKRCEKV